MRTQRNDRIFYEDIMERRTQREVPVVPMYPHADTTNDENPSLT